jgi:hypothetical protein
VSETAKVSALPKRGVSAGDTRAQLWRHVLKEIDRFLTRVLGCTCLVWDAEVADSAWRAALGINLSAQ